MIREEKGRARSERTLNEQIQLLQADIKALSAEERETLLLALQELETQGPIADAPAAPTLLDTFAQVEWERQPVDIETFVKDEYYLGKTCDNLYPKLLEDMKELFSGGYHECVLSGSIGWGKSVLKSTTYVDGETGRLVSIADQVGTTPLVPSLDGTTVKYTRASKIWCCGRKLSYRMVLASGQWFEASLDHPVLTPAGYVELRQLKPGDFVAVARTLPAPVTPYSARSDAEVLLTAALLADGGLRGGSVVYTKGSRVLVDAVLAAAASLSEFEGVGRDVFERGAHYVTLKGLLPWVRSLGIDKLSKEKRVPAQYFGLADKQLALFLRWIFSDGNVYVGTPRKIELVLASEGLVDDVQCLLRRFGVVARKTFAPKTIKRVDGSKETYDAWRLQIADAPMQIAFLERVGPIVGKEAACAQLLAQAQGTRSNPNWDVVPVTTRELKEIRKATGPHTNKEWNAIASLEAGSCMGRDKFRRLCDALNYDGLYRKFADMDVVWERIESFTELGMQDVYDLTVPGPANAAVNGGLIVHNTFFASIGVCRLLYELSCMRDPQKSYGLAPGSVIAITCFSVNEMLAMKVVFENIINKLQASPYFKEHFPYELTKKEMRFPSKKLWLAARASTDSSALGLNTIGALVDETNFMPDIPKSMRGRMGAEVTGRAQSIYNTIKRRMKSRFSRQGQLPGMLFIVSSKKTRDDFTAKLVRSMKTDASMFVRDYAQWDVKPEEFFTTQKFPVLCGNESTPSKILTADEAAVLRSKELDEGLVILDVPEEFRSDFENDIEGAIRDIGGISTVAMSPFIQRREKLVAAVDSRLSHPFSTLEYQIGSSGTFEWSRMVRAHTNHHGETIWQPLINPAAARHVHIDPSLTGDCTGLVMAHIAGMKDVVRRKDGKQHVERLPIFLVDLTLRIRPPTAGEIDLGDVRQLIYMLRDHGYRITQLTMDRYNSADTLQQVRKKGIKSELLSVDVKPEPYEHLKTAFYEERVVMYDYPPLAQELQQLEKDHRKNKVDHPVLGSKDIADALAGVLYSLSQTRGSGSVLPILPGVSYSARDATPAQMGYTSGTRGLSILVGGGSGGGYVLDTDDDDGAWSDL